MSVTFRLTIALAFSLPVLWSCPASTQKIVGIGTNQTAIGQMGTAIASVVSKGELQMRPQVVAATEQYVPMVNANRIEFGIANSMQTLMSIQGVGLSQGRPNTNLRIVAVLAANELALMVPRNSGIKSVGEIRGKRAPGGWTAQEVGRYLFSGLIANGGVAWSELTQVPVAGFPQQFQAFQEGRLDVALGIVGQGAVSESDSRVPLQFLSMSDSPDAVKRMQAEVPGSYVTKVEPRQGLVGVHVPTNAMSLDYILFSNNKVEEEVVYAVAKAMFEGADALKATGPLWHSFHVKQMTKAIGADFHPGAIRLYKEKNAWPQN